MPYRIKGNAVQVQKDNGVWRTIKEHASRNMAVKHLRALKANTSYKK